MSHPYDSIAPNTSSEHAKVEVGYIMKVHLDPEYPRPTPHQLAELWREIGRPEEFALVRGKEKARFVFCNAGIRATGNWGDDRDVIEECLWVTAVYR